MRPVKPSLITSKMAPCRSEAVLNQPCAFVRSGEPRSFTKQRLLMKAPMSKLARRIFSDDEAAQEVMNAARKGESTKVEVDGKTYRVQRASKSRDDDLNENGSSSE